LTQIFSNIGLEVLLEFVIINHNSSVNHSYRIMVVVTWFLCSVKAIHMLVI